MGFLRHAGGCNEKPQRLAPTASRLAASKGTRIHQASIEGPDKRQARSAPLPSEKEADPCEDASIGTSNSRSTKWPQGPITQTPLTASGATTTRKTPNLPFLFFRFVGSFVSTREHWH